jgi:uncharacterized membrane protein
MRSVKNSPIESSAYVAPSDAGATNGGTDLVSRPKHRHLAGYIALGILAVYASWAVAVVWQRWGQLNPNQGSQAREYANIVLSPSQHPWYFPMLAGHVLTASVALVTCIFQIWPWLRVNHPSLHRYIGRVNIFVGVFPAVVFGLIVEVFWPFSVATMLSQVFVLALWGFVTAMGLRMGRKGLTEEHRRWMLRSFALTCSVLVEVSIDPALEVIIGTEFHSRLMSSKDIFMQLKDSNENWLGLFIIILCVEGFLERERFRRIVRPQLAVRQRESASTDA